MSKPVQKTMKAISLWQPWASLIPGEFKRYETRSWKPPAYLMGALLAIHAAKRWTPLEQAYTGRFIRQYPETAPLLRPEGYMNPPLGAILCVCRLVDYIHTDDKNLPEDVTDRERAFGDWSSGRFAWRLEIVRVVPTPIPCAGHQGIWNWEYDLPAES